MNEANTFQILLATDCHLGYMERDPIRSCDSFITFEEILQIAIDKNVDFILLGGDLFHENKPSRKSLHQCMSLLRKYCMGDRPITFHFQNDLTDSLSSSQVNYEDPNLNISMPIFSIHGNHDDPAGYGSLCSLDLLSVTGLVNYFGKCLDLETVQVSPLQLKKGQTKLCIYGLGSIRDERLHRLFQADNVKMQRPLQAPDDWFNLMVIHQNRAKHGATNYIPEHYLPDFLHLVFWGHEHECRIKEEWNSQRSFYVTQPGSSVATSLCHGEAVPKQVGILSVEKQKFNITEVPLRTVRQFYIKDIDLEEIGLNLYSPDVQDQVINYCKEIVDGLLRKAIAERSGHPDQPLKPLIRLRIFYPEYFDTFNVHRFGQIYIDKVANSKDMVLFTRKKGDKKPVNIDVDALKSVLNQERLEETRVEDLVKEYFQIAEEKKKLSLLSENGVNNAVQEYVDKEVSEAITVLIDHQLQKVQGYLKSKPVNDEDIDGEIENLKQERMSNSSQEIKEFHEALKNFGNVSQRSKNGTMDTTGFFDNDEDESTMVIAPSSSRARGRGRGRGSRGGRGRGNSRNAANNDRSPPSSRKQASSRSSTREANLKQQVIKFEPSSPPSNSSRSSSKRLLVSDSDTETEIIDDDDDYNDYKSKPKKRTRCRF